MANRYWVGGAGTWSSASTANWSASSGGASGASVPTAADSVFFDQAGTYGVTLSGVGLTCLDLTVSAGTVSFTSGGVLAISGSMSLLAGTSWGASGALTFNATTTGKTITTNGTSLSPSSITFNGAGGGWTLGSALTTTGTGGVIFTQGTFNTGNFACTSVTWTLSGSSTRAVSLGSSTITLSSAGTPWSASTTTNLTFTAGTSTINFTASGPTISFGGLTYSTVTFSSTSGNSSGTISGANTFTNLSFAGAASLVKEIVFSANQTVTGTFTANSGTYNARTSFVSNLPGTSRTITAATVAIAYCDFRDITGAGAGSWTGTSLGNCAGNSGITFSAAKTVYWNLSGAQNWAATGWATSSGGAPAAANFPLAQDTATFDNTGSVTGTITINNSWNIGTIDMSTRTSAMTLSTSNQTPYMFGSWKNGTGTTLSGTGIIYFLGRGTQQITSNGIAFTQPITIDSFSGTVQPQDAFTTSNATTLTTGGLDLNSKTFTTTTFTSNTSNTRTLAFGVAGGITVTASSCTFATTSLTVTGSGTISLTSASAKTFTGGNFSYSGVTLNQGGAGALSVTGSNTFSDITNTYSATGATSILFTAGTTTTVSNWSASGSAGNLLTINSITAATHTLSKTTGTVNANYLSLTNSIATGGATWNAINSVNNGGNTGWIFKFPGNFFFMFN
jgi:hypothetical protein